MAVPTRGYLLGPAHALMVGTYSNTILCSFQKCVKVRFHAPWLGISSGITPGMLHTLSVVTGKRLTKVNKFFFQSFRETGKLWWGSWLDDSQLQTVQFSQGWYPQPCPILDDLLLQYSLFQLFQPIPAYSSVFQPIPVHLYHLFHLYHLYYLYHL